MPFELPWMNASQSGTLYKSADHPDGIFVFAIYYLGISQLGEVAAKVNELATRFAGDPRVQVLDVGVDADEAAYEHWISDNHPNHPLLMDADQKVTGQLVGELAFPTFVVTDKNGKTAAWVQGYSEQTGLTEIENAVIALEAQMAR
jgi:hypothetical protein